MSKSEYNLWQCFISASRVFAKNIIVVILTVALLPLPGFVYWPEAPMLLLCIELTLLDCFYLMVAVFLIYGMFSSGNESISIGSVLSAFLKPGDVLIRCYKFFFSESPGIWKTLFVTVIGIIFGLGVQWLAAPYKISAEQNLIGACIYLACLLIWSQELVGWMMAPFYLVNQDLAADEAYRRSLFFDKKHEYWNLRLTAALTVMVPVLILGIIRYVFLRQPDFENFQHNLFLTYVTSIIPWMLAVFGVFLWHEIYKQRIQQTSTVVVEE